jgi:acetyl/propionyl-CoA carboxylase alpha subunit
VGLNAERPWINASLSVSINGISIRAYIATEIYSPNTTSATGTGVGERVFCHFPLFGTFHEYNSYNLLSFCESIRESVARDSGALSKAIVAPMPCKILSVLKKDGEIVAPGETVMVIESMKMEMTMSMSQGGKFEAHVRKGDSANEGTLLCRVV